MSIYNEWLIFYCNYIKIFQVMPPKPTTTTSAPVAASQVNANINCRLLTQTNMWIRTWMLRPFWNLNKFSIYLMLITVVKFQSLKLLIQLKHLILKEKLRILLPLFNLQPLPNSLISKHSFKSLDNPKLKLNQHLGNSIKFLIQTELTVLVLKTLKEPVI
jgi:hypothetical protein